MLPDWCFPPSAGSQTSHAGAMTGVLCRAPPAGASLLCGQAADLGRQAAAAAAAAAAGAGAAWLQRRSGMRGVRHPLCAQRKAGAAVPCQRTQCYPTCVLHMIRPTQSESALCVLKRQALRKHRSSPCDAGLEVAETSYDSWYAWPFTRQAEAQKLWCCCSNQQGLSMGDCAYALLRAAYMVQAR